MENEWLPKRTRNIIKAIALTPITPIPIALLQFVIIYATDGKLEAQDMILEKLDNHSIAYLASALVWFVFWLQIILLNQIIIKGSIENGAKEESENQEAQRS